MILEIEHPLFYYEHISDSAENVDLIKKFTVAERSGFGLEYYLKETAIYDDENSLNSTYLVKDKSSKEIVGYFSLKTGLFTIGVEGSDDYFDSIPAVELSNFAVNATYRRMHPNEKGLGLTMLRHFIIPIIQHIKNFVAVRALYIYALPEEKLIQHYESMGFSRLNQEEEDFVHSHVKPKYDDGCIFMYQIV